MLKWGHLIFLVFGGVIAKPQGLDDLAVVGKSQLTLMSTTGKTLGKLVAQMCHSRPPSSPSKPIFIVFKYVSSCA